jgi:hypothetical protein
MPAYLTPLDIQSGLKLRDLALVLENNSVRCDDAAPSDENRAVFAQQSLLSRVIADDKIG